MFPQQQHGNCELLDSSETFHQLTWKFNLDFPFLPLSQSTYITTKYLNNALHFSCYITKNRGEQRMHTWQKLKYWL